MPPIEKTIIRDAADHPVAVQVSCADWLRIEGIVESAVIQRRPATDLSEFRGTLALRIDPLDFQRAMRDEWN